MSDASEPRFFNRELSWLEFNQRVLDEANNEALPLLERLKFLAITASNLDEFVMVRVGGLKLLSERGSTQPDPAGYSPSQQLELIGQRLRKMVAAQYATFLEELEPGLAEAGVQRLSIDALNERQERAVAQTFENDVYSILSPIAVTQAEDFPLLPNQTVNLCVRLKGSAEDDSPRMAVIPLGEIVSRFVTLPSDGGYAYVLIEDVIRAHAERLFEQETILECIPFRLTRNADITLREDLAGDLMADMQDIVHARRRGDCIRLEIPEQTSEETANFLIETLEILPGDAQRVPGPIDLSAWFGLTRLTGFDHLKDRDWAPQQPPAIDPTVPMFQTIAAGDVLLFHPYDSFEPVVRFIEEAAEDPDVVAIKQTLYRTSRKSPIVDALRRAAGKGKYVTAVVELKARFDEQRNIDWARRLETEGVHVVYGVKGLKTHAKTCLVVRREPHGMQRYVHFGTGNYNELTSRVYSDVSYLTMREDFASDAVSFFNAITGYSQPMQYRRIAAAPMSLRDRALELIDTEAKNAADGRAARIDVKINSLVDKELIEALYRASQLGVEIRLNVRGICCLRPGVPGLSDRITVTSIVDRFLEHARIFHFHHGGQRKVFISSADWMTRNLDRRVELLVPIDDEQAKRRLLHILDVFFRDDVKARVLQPDGSYVPRATDRAPDAPGVRSQEIFWQEAVEAVRQAERSRRTMYQPHQRSET